MSELERVLAQRNGKQWASEVYDWLFLGNARDAKNLDALHDHKITHILNVADDVPCFFEDRREFVYKQLGVRDFGADQGISRVFDSAFKFIEEVKEKNGRVLIHCAAGQNRSVTITIAIIMLLEKMSLRDAFDFVRSKRRRVCPFRDNREELCRFEYKLFGTSSMSSSEFLNCALSDSHHPRTTTRDVSHQQALRTSTSALSLTTAPSAGSANAAPRYHTKKNSLVFDAAALASAHTCHCADELRAQAQVTIL